MEDSEKVKETPRIDKVNHGENTNRNFSDIADELHNNLINLEILRDEGCSKTAIFGFEYWTFVLWSRTSCEAVIKHYFFSKSSLKFALEDFNL